MGRRRDGARAANLGHAARSRAARVGVRAEGEVGVRYCAHNGCEYRVDVSRMVQTKLATGSRRSVLREVLEGFGVAWSFDSCRRGGRSDQCAVYTPYPSEVCAVLEHRYRTHCAAALVVQKDPRSTEAQEAAVNKLTNAALRTVFGLNVTESTTGTELTTTSGDDSDKGFGTHRVSPDPIASAPPDAPAAACSNSRRVKLKAAARLAARVGPAEPALADCLFERVLRSKWSQVEVAAAVSWLLRRGFQFSPAHCRKVALLHGSLMVLRVLLVDARVDVRGLELLSEAPRAAARGRAACADGGWVQRCKAAVKVLLARGARLGGAGTRSKLLKRLEDDAQALLRARALATWCQALPDVMLGHIADYANIAAPFAWRDFNWPVCE